MRSLRLRRRYRCGAHLCAAASALLLLFSVSLLHTRLSQPHHPHLRSSTAFQNGDDLSSSGTNPLLSDSNDYVFADNNNDDKIDVSDIADENDNDPNFIAEQEDFIVKSSSQEEVGKKKALNDGFYFDHLSGSIRRRLNRRSIDEWDDDYTGFNHGSGLNDPSMTSFGSDDIPVNEYVRKKVSEVRDVEDALLLKLGKKVSPLREGWGDWFDKKSNFLRRDKMFKSNLEVLNPLNNPMLQDPDGIGVTSLTRGDKVIQKLLLSELKRVPYSSKKPLGVSESTRESNFEENEGGRQNKPNVIEKGHVVEAKRGERRTLDENETDGLIRRVTDDVESLNSSADNEVSNKQNKSGVIQDKKLQGNNDLGQHKDESSGSMYADGKRWGYYPDLHPHLSFSDFLDSFFKVGNCTMRVFVVWNSPSWMYSVRHQRGLESLLFHHRDACVVVLSETIELNFLKDSFVKDGYKVAIAMPNLEELLEDTPTRIFASVWFEWRKAKYYSTHYSELLRLASLYKYGGIYLDSDVIVLKSLSSLDNTVGLEDQPPGSSLNGAVMAFRKHSFFIKECLKEYYTTYDDTSLRWNGADLLTRVAKKFQNKKQELQIQPSFVFFPISSQNITRYFTGPATEAEKAQQDALFKKILDESMTFHYWNSLTSSLIPEPESLVARLIDQNCIHCFDVL